MRDSVDDGHEGFAEPATEVEEQLSTHLLAAYGGAYLEAERLHHRLAEVYAHTFKKPLGGCRERVDEKLVLGHALTLGQLVGEAKRVLPENLHGDLDRQAEARKGIAHAYWRHARRTIGTPEGKRAAATELLQMAGELHRLQGALQDHEREYARRLAKALEHPYEEPRSLPWDSLGEYKLPETPRAIKGEELIVAAWLVSVDDENEKLCFECDDGLTLQLGDNGLAWSYAKKDATWLPQPELQQRLPARVKARPICKEEWDYTIEFGNMQVVVTERGPRLEPVPPKPQKGKKGR